MEHPKSGCFAIVGDLQRTSRAEFWRESNDEESRRLLAEIAARRPDFVVGLGDLVFRGSSRRDWARFDALTAPLREADVPVFPFIRMSRVDEIFSASRKSVSKRRVVGKTLNSAGFRM